MMRIHDRCFNDSGKLIGISLIYTYQWKIYKLYYDAILYRHCFLGKCIALYYNVQEALQKNILNYVFLGVCSRITYNLLMYSDGFNSSNNEVFPYILKKSSASFLYIDALEPGICKQLCFD